MGTYSLTRRGSPEVERARVPPSPAASVQRVSADGKFLFVGNEKFYVRGVTYGAFRPDDAGNEYHDLDRIDRDFAQMAAAGINAVRIPHTTPPRDLLDVAARHGLRVMVGLSAEQYAGYLIDRKGAPDIEGLVREKVRALARHPALLCYGLGNEIRAPLARWIGPERISRYLERLYRAVKAEDPEGLVTYVNYPTTEYLELPFLDLMCFNVYLESPERFDAYLARLQNLAGDRPLILSEAGLDSLRNGEAAQAESLEWQIQRAFGGGCAGVFIFSWTDEWHRDGAEVEDWAFGITRRDREPKPAFAAVRRAFTDVPFSPDMDWPWISVVVCTHNGRRVIRECLEALTRVEYPRLEIIVVDDGSTDGTAAVVQEYPFRLIQTPNRGLSSARNTGLAAAMGEIVAYIDDDAHPDPHWLHYVASTFLRTTHAAVGGPNIPPRDEHPVAACVANAPGGPVHVLLSDSEAEHIPGCNMAFRKACLEAIGGFDPQFQIAGDDVDVCWRLQERGWTLGFHPAAVVWHHRRSSVRAYWKQQVGYGRAEAMLERKWPEKYNGGGHPIWGGRIYGQGVAQTLLRPRGRIYHGSFGVAPFQRLYRPVPWRLGFLPLMPEWYLLIPVLLVLAGLGALWTPLYALLIPAALSIAVSVSQAMLGAAHARFARRPGRRLDRWKQRALTALLHLLQPAARLRGRMVSGLRPWRLRDGAGWSWPTRRAWAIWREHGEPPERLLRTVEASLRSVRGVVRRGGEFDRWDFGFEAGMLGGARLLLACEDHGEGRQLVRCRAWPTWSAGGIVVLSFFAGLSVAALLNGAAAAAAVLGGVAAAIVVRGALECAAAGGAVARAVKKAGGGTS